jgi:nucleoside-diphosphate-sugar epimerase
VTGRRVFVAGATGFVGRALAPALLARGHAVRALARPGSESRVPAGCEVVAGDPLDGASYAARIAPCDTFVHLVGTPHPAPWKGASFRRVDLGSAREAAGAAAQAGVRHFVYVSVAQPAPVMGAYVAARAEAEAAIRATGMAATFLRPWYVLGPGRRWPLALAPMYRALEAIPATRVAARRLGFVTLAAMVAALLAAVEAPPAGGEVRVLDVEAIRSAGGRG